MRFQLYRYEHLAVNRLVWKTVSDFEESTIEHALDNFGADGWELVFLSEGVRLASTTGFAIFKRRRLNWRRFFLTFADESNGNRDV